MRKVIYQRTVKDLEVIGNGWISKIDSELLSKIEVLNIPDGELFEQKVLQLEYIVGNCKLSATLEIRELDNAYIMYANDISIAVSMKVTNESN
jgi:hypothetical protein